MKNYIFKYYGIKIDKIYEKNDRKYFFINNNKYYVIESNKDEMYINMLAELTNKLFINNILAYTFILNKENKYYSIRNKNKICILKVNELENDLLFKDLIKFQMVMSNLPDYDIISEWENIIDTIEKEIIEYNKEFPLIRNSINYFIGLGENAIELLNTYNSDIKKNNDSIGHIVENGEFNLNNPFLFIKTNRMYDISNYIKYKFYNNKIDYSEIERILEMINSDYERIFLFASLLYPSFYFDTLKEIINNKVPEKNIKKYIDKAKDYKNLLVYIQRIFKNVNEICLINWISE